MSKKIDSLKKQLDELSPIEKKEVIQFLLLSGGRIPTSDGMYMGPRPGPPEKKCPSCGRPL
jgi:hypothetical protein